MHFARCNVIGFNLDYICSTVREALIHTNTNNSYSLVRCMIHNVSVGVVDTTMPVQCNARIG